MAKFNVFLVFKHNNVFKCVVQFLLDGYQEILLFYIIIYYIYFLNVIWNTAWNL